ncbi:MAG: hypothetical protein M3Y39_04675 [Chloroflexota bacterium]|nr:hypothetical protein [Chloroflexota bacterium]
MSSQLPPTRPGPILQGSTYYEPLQREQHYSPEQSKLPPPPPAYPTEKRGLHPLLRNWPWIAAIIAALMIGYGTGNYIGQATPPTVVVQSEATTQPTPATENSAQAIPTSAPTTPAQIIQPTPATEDSTQVTPTSAPTTQSQWVTTHTFTANGPMKTENFTVANEWKMQWTCNPASDGLGEYNVIVAVYNADGTSLDPMAFNTICKAGVTSGSTQEHQGGNVYLDNETDGNVTITVQELK